MVIIYSDNPSKPSGDPIEYYRKLLFELGDTLTAVHYDRRLAMYRAHQHGMEVAEIVRLTHTEIAEVQDAIDVLGHEPEADDWPIASWIPRYGRD